VRADLADLERSLEPAEAGHRDVHQDDVRTEIAAGLDRLEPVGGLADDLDVLGRLQKRADSLRGGSRGRPAITTLMRAIREAPPSAPER